MADQILKNRKLLKRRPLLGVTLNTCDPLFVDIAARFDFDVRRWRLSGSVDVA